MKYNNRKGRKADTTTVGDALQDMFAEYKIKGKLDETRLIASWEQLMGKTIAARTSKIFIRDRVLFVQLNSAPLRNELNLSKSKVFDIFEKEVGSGIITNIIFM